MLSSLQLSLASIVQHPQRIVVFLFVCHIFTLVAVLFTPLGFPYYNNGDLEQIRPQRVQILVSLFIHSFNFRYFSFDVSYLGVDARCSVILKFNCLMIRESIETFEMKYHLSYLASINSNIISLFSKVFRNRFERFMIWQLFEIIMNYFNWLGSRKRTVHFWIGFFEIRSDFFSNSRNSSNGFF